MPVRMLRPRTDDGRWAIAVAVAAVALFVGYVGGRRFFDPGPQPPGAGSEASTAPGAQDEPTNEVEARDAGRGDSAVARAETVGSLDGGVPDLASADSGAPANPPSTGSIAPVPVRIVRASLQSCGDGEELDLRGDDCAAVPQLEDVLRRHLRVLETCPSAAVAAERPDQTLSLGLRVDFPRRRVTPLPGRSSSVHDALTFVACVRGALAHLDDVFTLSAAHARYLYFFSVRFGPISSQTVSAPSARNPIPLRRPQPATILVDRANLRATPPDGTIVGRLAQGTAVQVIARDGTWWQVRAGALTGWLYGRSIGR